MDDILSGFNSYDGLITVRSQLNSLLNSTGFEWYKWYSNSKIQIKILSSYSEEQNNFEITSTKDVDKQVLGLSWNPKIDSFSVTLSAQVNITTYTKRNTLFL